MSGFTAQERAEVHLNPPDHTYRPPFQLSGSHFPRNLATDVPAGCADRHLLPSPGLGFKIFVESRKEVWERRS